MSEKKQELPPDEPATLADWFWKICQYEDSIYVRELAGKKWKAVTLASLPPKQWGQQVARMLEVGMNPVRLRGKEEK